MGQARTKGSRFAIGVAVLAALLTMAAASNASAADSAGITRIISPTSNQVVGSGGVRVLLRSRARLARLHVFIDGTNVKRYLHPVSAGYRADLRLGRGLHRGVDELIVATGDGTDVDTVQFVVARQNPKLLKVIEFRVDGPQAPVLFRAKVGAGSTLQAWVNGHRDDSAFGPEGRSYVGRLGDNDWLRPGRNRLRVLAYRTARNNRSASYTVRTRIFWQKPGRLTASAGRNVVVTAGDFIQLDGTAADLGRKGAHHFRYRWKITGRPGGQAPTLAGPNRERPAFEAREPGNYELTTTVTGPNGTTSSDTVTVTARADLPPIGGRLDTVADDRGTITLDGKALPNTTEPCDPGPLRAGCSGYASYAIFNRQTLLLRESGNVKTDAAGVASLLALATKYNAAPTNLMVVNLSGPFQTTAHADLRKLFNALGVRQISDSDFANMAGSFMPLSIVGVPGSPLGSAFISNYNAFNRTQSGAMCFGVCLAPRQWASMQGYLRLNPTSPTGGYFEFVFNDQTEFNTDASTTASQISMKVGGATYSHSVPADGSSGFFLVRVNSRTLAPEKTFFYVTNKADGSEDPAEAQRLADDVGATSANHGLLLGLLQSFGTPKGTSPQWLALARTIQSLGGNAQVFAQLNQNTQHQGRYAFVSRGEMDTTAAESSGSLTGNEDDGTLHGLLGRGHDDQFEPLVADPTGTINFDLVRIVNRQTAADGGFMPFNAEQAAAASYLGRDPSVMGVCASDAKTCDVRKEYWDNYYAPWGDILTQLDGSPGAAACDKRGGELIGVCNDVRKQLVVEIGQRNRVQRYFDALQSPFGSSQVAAQVDLKDITEQIRQAAQPPTDANATAHALTIISFILKIGTLSGAVCPPCGSVAGGLGAVFGIATYLTAQNGSPDLIGPQVTAKSTELGQALFDRYRDGSNYMETEAQIVMSDESKMSEVSKAAFSTDGWKPGNSATVAEGLRLASKQTIWQSLLPAAYPELYDLGTGITHATDWRCIGEGVTIQKRLFQHTDPGAELHYKMTDPSYIGQDHLFVVGARHAVSNLSSAYIPSPPASLTDRLFRDPTLGGIGLYKLSFYSPQYFHVFDRVFQMTVRTDQRGYYYCQSIPNPPDNAGP